MRGKKNKKIRKRSLRGNSLSLLSLKKALVWTGVFLTIILLIISGKYLYTVTVGAPKFVIEKIAFDETSLKYLQDLSVYADMIDALKGHNFLRTKWIQKDSLLEDLQALHPILEDFTIQLTADSSVFVTLTFFSPKLIFQTPTHYFISYNETLYPVNKESPFLNESFVIQLPSFSSGWDDINGIYWKYSEKELQTTTQLIITTLGTANITELIYQPGGQRLYLIYKGKRVYLNLSKDINVQLEKLLTIENNRNEFPQTWTIDPGSREEIIVK